MRGIIPEFVERLLSEIEEHAKAFWLADMNSNAKEDQKQTTDVLASWASVLNR